VARGDLAMEIPSEKVSGSWVQWEPVLDSVHQRCMPWEYEGVPHYVQPTTMRATCRWHLLRSG
jgi:hypothetical protein